MFHFYSVLFGFAVVMMLRSLVKGDWDAVDAYFILAAFSFITLCDLLYWGDMGTRFGFWVFVVGF
jgi:hypothetical protein